MIVRGRDAHLLAALLAVMSTSVLRREHFRKPVFAIYENDTHLFRAIQPPENGVCQLEVGEVIHGFQFHGWNNTREARTSGSTGIELCIGEVACFALAQRAMQKYNLRGLFPELFLGSYVAGRFKNRWIKHPGLPAYTHIALLLAGGIIYGSLHLIAWNHDSGE
jgi:hypothetical protein